MSEFMRFPSPFPGLHSPGDSLAHELGGVLGHDVPDPGAHRGLGTGEVLQLVLAPAGRRQLQHEADLVPLHVHRRLVPGGDVGRWGVVHLVDAAQQGEVEARQLVALRVVRRGEVGHVAMRQHVYLDRPAGGERHERRPVLAAEDDPRRCPLGLQDSLEQVRPEAVDGVDQSGGARGDVGVGVDLPVRVVQGHADGLAAVLEREHLLDAGQRGQRGGAIRPRLDHGAGARRRLASERALVGGAEADDLAAADGGAGAAESDGGEVVEAARSVLAGELRAERRRTVLEHGHVVVVGNLGGVGFGCGGERILVGGRQEHAILPGRGDGDPLSGERILAHRRRDGPRIEDAGIRLAIGREGRVGVVEIDQLTPVGKPVFAFGNLRHSTSSKYSSAGLPPIGWTDARTNRRTV
jgi:hypothetical protein